MSSPTPPKTNLIFHHSAHLHTHPTTILTLTPFDSLPPLTQSLFKSSLPSSLTPTLSTLTCPSTIFHPQGGGQPSDTGSISSPSTTFTVLTARTDASGQVLHLGHFSPTADSAGFSIGESVEQKIDPAARLLFSRLHTAGHVLGAAVRRVCGDSVPGFEELKASHFPGSASCEFAGLIDGKWKEGIQKAVDEIVEGDLPVEIEWWDEGEFRRRGLERLIPDREAMGLGEGERFRVVNIVGAEVYPCGGTHVRSTGECGRTVVRKLGRSKGVSRVGYTVEGA